ncbi:MAG: pseudouridine synthase [Microthrixaceae bacterium]
MTVNGEVAVLGRRVDVDHDEVALDGTVVSVNPTFVYRLLNKPAGVDDRSRHTRPTDRHRTGPGRSTRTPGGLLDMETEGLLLLTNDGTLTHRLTHPSFGVPKEYLAEVQGSPSARRCAPCAREWNSTTAARLRPRWRCAPRTCSGSRSTRAGTARCAGCARRSATPL